MTRGKAIADPLAACTLTADHKHRRWLTAPSLILFDGAAWSGATDGRLLAARRERARFPVASDDGQAAFLSILREVTSAGRPARVVRLLAWAGKAPQRPRCEWCKFWRREKRKDCGNCGGTSLMSVWPNGSVGKIAGIAVDRAYLARLLATAPTEVRDVAVSVAKSMLCLWAPSWRAALMSYTCEDWRIEGHEFSFADDLVGSVERTDAQP